MQGRGALPVRGPAVVQAPDSMGGEGTFFVRGPADVEHTAAEAPVLVGEDPEPRDLRREACRLGLAVPMGHPEQDAQARPDFAHDLPRDPHPRLGNALADGPHAESTVIR